MNEQKSTILHSSVKPDRTFGSKLRKRCEVGTCRNSLAEPFFYMMSLFMTLDDNAEIVHSEMGNFSVRVYIEKPDAKDGFHRLNH